MLLVPSVCHSNKGIASILVGAGFNILNVEGPLGKKSQKGLTKSTLQEW